MKILERDSEFLQEDARGLPHQRGQVGTTRTHTHTHTHPHTHTHTHPFRIPLRHYLLQPRNRQNPNSAQWNPKSGCRGTFTAWFALIALVVGKHWLDSTLRELSVIPKYGRNGKVSRAFPLTALIALAGLFPQHFRGSPNTASR